MPTCLHCHGNHEATDCMLDRRVAELVARLDGHDHGIAVLQERVTALEAARPAQRCPCGHSADDRLSRGCRQGCAWADCHPAEQWKERALKAEAENEKLKRVPAPPRCARCGEELSWADDEGSEVMPCQRCDRAHEAEVKRLSKVAEEQQCELAALREKLDAAAREVNELRASEDEARTQVACAADLANSWARERNVEECENPWHDLRLRALIDRLWHKSSVTIHELREKLAAAPRVEPYSDEECDAVLKRIKYLHERIHTQAELRAALRSLPRIAAPAASRGIPAVPDEEWPPAGAINAIIEAVAEDCMADTKRLLRDILNRLPPSPAVQRAWDEDVAAYVAERDIHMKELMELRAAVTTLQPRAAAAPNGAHHDPRLDPVGPGALRMDVTPRPGGTIYSNAAFNVLDALARLERSAGPSKKIKAIVVVLAACFGPYVSPEQFAESQFEGMSRAAAAAAEKGGDGE